MHASCIRVVVAALALASGWPHAPLPAQEPTSRANRSAAAILDAFRSHPVVLLGESHRSANFSAFLHTLLAKPELADRVNDIVIESGSVRFQPLLDRYIRGDSVPYDSVRLVWRNTTQLLAWDSPVYEEVLRTVRALNRTLPPARQLRVIAGDPPVDWPNVRVAADFPPSFGDRDWQAVDVLEHEVLDRGRHALVIMGSVHVYRRPPGPDSLMPPLRRAGLADALHRTHPGLAYSVATVTGGAQPALERKLARRVAPGTLVPVAGTPLGNESSSLLFGRDITRFRVVNGQRVSITLAPRDYPALQEELDALLYLGPRDRIILPNASIYRDDPAYLAEVRRRIGILTEVYGGDFWSSELDSLVRSR
jgi:hypothetical protein